MTAELDLEAALAARFAREGEPGVRRASFEVGGEQVSLLVRSGRLRALCTCGHEHCEHVSQALRFLGFAGTLANADLRIRSSLRPPAPQPTLELAALGEAFDELSLALARTGVSSPDSPSIRAALDQIVARAPQPTPLGLARWIARVNETLANGDVGKLARVLDGARTLADELKRGDRSPAALARRRVWLELTDSSPAEALTDATLLEVARERLTGLTRAAIERRYLMDLGTGEVLREERRRGDHDVSVGPCPRVVHVAFAELEPACLPRRVRLLQYTVAPQPTLGQWERVTEHAVRSVRELGQRYADGARTCPGQAEPFVLFAPAELTFHHESMLRDDEGGRLALGDESDAPLADAVRSAAQTGEILWIAGRLVGLARGLVLRPSSTLLRRNGSFQLCRIS